MRVFRKSLLVGLLLLLIAPNAFAEKSKFKIAWSIYVGWMPWSYAADNGIVDKWAEKYGIEIEFVQINDYIESINLYTAGEFDGCSMTNMDALTIPAAGGVDSTALIVGDFSNGNDGIVMKDKSSLSDIKGEKVHLVELSVSHYLLARALETVQLAEKDITVVNISDADIVGAYASGSVSAVTTWNPQLSEVAGMKGSTKVFDSSQIPGEIIDMLVVNSETLAANPKLGKALIGAWYETMATMSAEGETATKAKTSMAIASGTDLAGYESQLATTRMFYEAKDALAFVRSGELSKTMKNVVQFSFDHGLLGQGASSTDTVGILFPNGDILGDKKNVKLRFDDVYHAMAAKGAL